MSERNLQLLASPGLLAGLFLLLLNDFILKPQFHNAVTGKLSDFAGLFVFPLFWAAFFPRRRVLIYVSTAVLFTVWKSVYSQTLIDAWNSFPLLPIGRTVDYGDLLALALLPLSYAYSRLPTSFRIPRPALHVIAMVSIFAFTATQYRHKVSYNNEYIFPYSKKLVMVRMSQLTTSEVPNSFWDADTFEIRFDSCTGEATVTIFEKENQSILTLKEMNHRCPGEPNKQKMLEYFEKEFINKLRERPVSKSAQVQHIWGTGPSAPSPPPPSPSNSSVQPTLQ